MSAGRRVALALLLALGGGCEPTPPRVSSHVEDWRDRVIYQVLVDRFENGDPSNDSADGVDVVPGDLSRAQGGDWRGVIDRLDYIERLGMSAIWISPIVANVPRIESEDGYHGYWASDFTTHNPRFGSLEELKALVTAAHARDIAVIVDVVVNHAGRVFAYDLDTDGALDPGEDDPSYRVEGYDVPLLWHGERPRLFVPGSDGADSFALDEAHFHRRGIGNLGDYEQRRYGDFPTGLRDLDTERDDVIDALIETFTWWVLETDVDGFRIDAVPHAEIAFHQRFCDGVRRRLAAHGKHRFFMLGEIFETDPAELARHTAEGALDAGFDFPLKVGLIDFVILGGAAPSTARLALEQQRSLFRDVPQPLGIDLSPWEARVAVADNHDLPRVRGEVDDPFAVDQALIAVFTVDAIPGVYYGTEQEFSGRFHHEAREVMGESGFREDLPTFALIQHLARLRRGSHALRRGGLEVRYASEVGGAELDAPTPDAGMIAWERAHEAERVLVVMNTHPLQISIAAVPTGFAPGTTLIDRLGGELTFEVTSDGSIDASIAPRSSVILEAR